MLATFNSVERVTGIIAERRKRKRARWNRGPPDLRQMASNRKTRPAVCGRAVRSYFRWETVA